jgi:hypothetical protein
MPRTFLILSLVSVLASTGCEPDPEGPDTTWHEAFDARPVGWLMSTWAPSSTFRYAAGGAPEAGVLMATVDGHADRTADTWARVGVDDPAFAGVPLLTWVTGFGPDDVTVVGARGTILHFDGATWTRATALTDQDLWGVWGASAADLWAVGGTTSPGGHPVILRFDGAWHLIDTPALQKGNVRAFFKVWGTDEDNVLIVGQNGVVLRWDGQALHEELVGASDDLIALWGTDRDHIAAVGGRGVALLSTWNGAAWTTTQLPPLSGLNGVWMDDPEVIHVVGTLGVVATIDFTTHRVQAQTLSRDLDFHAVHGDPSGRLTAVGGSFRSPVAPFQGLAWERALAPGE